MSVCVCLHVHLCTCLHGGLGRQGLGIDLELASDGSPHNSKFKGFISLLKCLNARETSIFQDFVVSLRVCWRERHHSKHFLVKLMEETKSN